MFYHHFIIYLLLFYYKYIKRIERIEIHYEYGEELYGHWLLWTLVAMVSIQNAEVLS